MLPEVLVCADIAGRLIRLLVEHAAPSLPPRLLTLPDRHPSPELRSFIALAIKMFSACPKRGPRLRS